MEGGHSPKRHAYSVPGADRRRRPAECSVGGARFFGKDAPRTPASSSRRSLSSAARAVTHSKRPPRVSSTFFACWLFFHCYCLLLRRPFICINIRAAPAKQCRKKEKWAADDRRMVPRSSPGVAVAVALLRTTRVIAGDDVSSVECAQAGESCTLSSTSACKCLQCAIRI